jgi:hypothetical protein
MRYTRTERSVRNGIKILKNAIRRNISLSEASRRANFGKNYVSDIKLRLKENYKNKNICRDMYREFNSLMKQYMA